MTTWLEKQGLSVRDLPKVNKELKKSIGGCKYRDRYNKAYNKGRGWFDGTYRDYLEMLKNLMQNA